MNARELAEAITAAVDWSQLNSDAADALRKQLHVTELWGDLDAADFLSKLPKPPRAPKRARRPDHSGSLVEDARAAVMAGYLSRLRENYGDHRLTCEVVELIRSDKRIRKSELDKILEEIGSVKAANKDTAFKHLISWSAQGQSDRIAAMRIKQGA